jgi:thioredoxin-related protein
MPRVVRLAAHEYTSRYQAFPKPGQEVDWVPYFKARTLEITDTDVALELLAVDGQRVEEEFGVAEIGVAGEEVKITLTPRIGAPFAMQDREGRIVSTDGRSFTVDFNAPLAGRSAVVDVEVVSLVKASALKGKEIAWIEDHDQGLEAAKSQGKPVVLVLYADWCSYCKKLFDETLVDPRIKAVGDSHVWVRVNSDKEKRIHQLYEQNGFPLIVLINGRGEPVKKIDGYRDAGTLRRELAALGSAT